MYCIKCGKELREGSKFCPGCGAPQVDVPTPAPAPAPYPAQGQKKGRNTALIVGMIAALLLVLGGVIVAAVLVAPRFLLQSRQEYAIELPEEGVYDTPEEVLPENAGSDAIDEDTAQPEGSDSAAYAMSDDIVMSPEEDLPYEEGEHVAPYTQSTELYEEFGIDPATIEDYSKNLDPGSYRYYDSGIGEFRFFYPAGLFHYVERDDETYETDFGTHVQTIRFVGSNGSELIYSLFRRNDGSSLKERTTWVHDREHSLHHNMVDILYRSDNEKGRIVMAGAVDETEAMRIYDLIKIEPEYHYQMISTHPAYQSEEEQNMYAYVTENEYRMCGFSGSTSTPRSYTEYLRAQ